MTLQGNPSLCVTAHADSYLDTNLRMLKDKLHMSVYTKYRRYHEQTSPTLTRKS